jgi:hypothetical protein
LEQLLAKLTTQSSEVIGVTCQARQSDRDHLLANGGFVAPHQISYQGTRSRGIDVPRVAQTRFSNNLSGFLEPTFAQRRGGQIELGIDRSLDQTCDATGHHQPAQGDDPRGNRRSQPRLARTPHLRLVNHSS